MQPSGSRRINPGVFWPALAVAGGFVTWGFLGPDSLAAVASATLNWIIRVFGWSFVISTAFFLAFAIFLAFSRFGRIKLGH
uniref:BCCT family transporter n=1 Tax=Escherichia marmotae TaxID=1499973 RepID=UPI0034D95CBD